MAARKKKVPLAEVDDYLEASDPIIAEAMPEPAEKMKVGKKVLVVLPNHSKQYRFMTQTQFKEGKVLKIGEIKLESGKILVPGRAYELEVTKEIKDLLMRGVLKGGGKPRF